MNFPKQKFQNELNMTQKNYGKEASCQLFRSILAITDIDLITIL